MLSAFKIEDLTDERIYKHLQDGIQLRLHQSHQFNYIRESGKVNYLYFFKNLLILSLIKNKDYLERISKVITNGHNFGKF